MLIFSGDIDVWDNSFDSVGDVQIEELGNEIVQPSRSRSI